MSMRYYPIDDYGLLVDDKVLHTLVSNIKNSVAAQNYLGWEVSPDEDELSLEDDVLNYLQESFGAYSCEDIDSLEFSTIVDTAQLVKYIDYDIYPDDSFFIIPINKVPSLFATAYTGVEEIVDELKSKYSALFPDDFDYASHLVHAVGCIYA